MTIPVYRKPTTSPFSLVQNLFATDEAALVRLDDLADGTGYSKNAISELRRPRKGRGMNPSFALVNDIANALGYKLTIVRINE